VSWRNCQWNSNTLGWFWFHTDSILLGCLPIQLDSADIDGFGRTTDNPGSKLPTELVLGWPPTAIPAMNRAIRSKRGNLVMSKKRKSKKQIDKETLVSVMKEMTQPRFAESARREEEDANHRVAKHRSFLST
jgi:hypothetical protein